MPIYPSNDADPTAQARRESAAAAALRRKVRQAARLYRQLLDRIEFRVIETNARVYEFRTLPAVLELMIAETDRLVDEIFLRDRWFFDSYIEPAYIQGTNQSMANLAAQSAAYRATRPTLQQLLMSEPYQRRLGLLRAREFELMKGFTAETRTALAGALTRGLATGLGPKVIAKDIAKATGVSERRADRIARTEVNNALTNARMDEALQAEQDIGLRTRVMHVSAFSPTTRPDHASRHGKLFTVAAQKEWWSQDGNRINCFLPGTRVAGRFVAGSKGRYKGVAVNLVTASGNNLRVTANHPVLTPAGLVAAAMINKGDYLVSHRGQVEDAARVSDLDNNQVQPSVEDVFGSLMQPGHSSIVRIRAVDFHGDGLVMDESVQVVRSDRELTVDCQSSLAQSLDQLALIHADSIAHSRFGTPGADFVAVDSSASGIMGGSDTGLPLFGSASRGADSRRLATVPVGQPRGGEPAIDSDSTDTDPFGNLQDRFTGQVVPMQGGDIVPTDHLGRSETRLVEPHVKGSVRDADPLGDLPSRDTGTTFLDQVVNVELFFFAGHVYDLEEVSGLMLAEGIITSNCRCSVVEVTVDEKGEPLSPGFVEKARKRRERYEQAQKSPE